MDTAQSDRKIRIKQHALNNLHSFLSALYPTGKIVGSSFHIGNIDGDPGQSMSIELHGEKAGLWHDFATGEGGDIFSLLAHYWGLDPKTQFPQLLDKAEDYFGLKVSHSCKPITTGTWVYQDADGQPWIRVQRVETKDKKEYFPFDLKKNIPRLTDTRPLYNLPNLAKADHIILVEGEKCAQALIDKGITATTYIGGANAPMSKTDSSPLKNKNIIIWPDNDDAGLKYAYNVVKAAKDAGAKSVKILKVPSDNPKSWDAADAIEEGFDYRSYINGNNFIEQDTSLIVATDPKDKKFGFMHVSELLNKISPTNWLIKGILEQHALSVIFGAPSSGKSFIAIDMSCCVATHTEFHGHKTTPGAVFYIAGEGTNNIRKRLKVWELYHKISLSSAPLYISHRSAQLYDEKSALEVEQAINELAIQSGQNPVLIIIDTLARNIGSGDENQTKDMNIFVSRVDTIKDKWKATALIVHHTGLQESGRPRGSSVLKCALDHEYAVVKEGLLIGMHCTKMKDSKEPDPFHFSLRQLETGVIDEDDEKETSCILEHLDVSPFMSSITGQPRKLLDLIRNQINTFGETISPSSGQEPILCLKIDNLKEAFKNARIVQSDKADSIGKGFRRNMEELKTIGSIDFNNEYLWLTDKPDKTGQT